MEWVKGSCGVSHPVLQCWVERVVWGQLGLGASSYNPSGLWGEVQSRNPGRAENTQRPINRI